MNAFLACGAWTLVAVGLCVAVGVSTEAAPPGEGWEEDPAWRAVCEEEAGRIETLLPLRLNVRGCARMAGARARAWGPMSPVVALLAAWAFVKGLDRRAEIGLGTRFPSPAVAFLAKRGMCVSFFAGVTAVFAPFSVPPWFAFLPAAGVIGFLHVYVSNLPDRL